MTIGGSDSHSRPRVGYIYDDGVGYFHFGATHPMKPYRLVLTHHLVNSYRLFDGMDVYCPIPATMEDLLKFHNQEYIQFLKRVTPSTFDPTSTEAIKYHVGMTDCPVFAGLYDFASRYSGGSLLGARKLISGHYDIAINWSGGLHHAKRAEASGFCYVNDIVLAILELLRFYPRVLYLDIDIHHGDAVQDAFYGTDRVMTVSFHNYGDNFFPGTGDMNEIGAARGKYYSLNIPFRPGIDDLNYHELFKPIVRSVIETYQPSCIVLQCGADSLTGDRLGVFNLSTFGHGDCVRFVKSFHIPTLVLGGGGYTMRNVARCWTYETGILTERTLNDELPENDYLEFFAPHYRLHTHVNPRMENMNPRQYLEPIRRRALVYIRALQGAPSIQMQEIPSDLYISDEEDPNQELSNDDPDTFAAQKSISMLTDWLHNMEQEESELEFERRLVRDKQADPLHHSARFISSRATRGTRIRRMEPLYPSKRIQSAPHRNDHNRGKTMSILKGRRESRERIHEKMKNQELFDLDNQDNPHGEDPPEEDSDLEKREEDNDHSEAEGSDEDCKKFEENIREASLSNLKVTCGSSTKQLSNHSHPPFHVRHGSILDTHKEEHDEVLPEYTYIPPMSAATARRKVDYLQNFVGTETGTRQNASESRSLAKGTSSTIVRNTRMAENEFYDNAADHDHDTFVDV